jgi:hypothetical protein
MKTYLIIILFSVLLISCSIDKNEKRINTDFIDSSKIEKKEKQEYEVSTTFENLLDSLNIKIEKKLFSNEPPSFLEAIYVKDSNKTYKIYFANKYQLESDTFEWELDSLMDKKVDYYQVIEDDKYIWGK